MAIEFDSARLSAAAANVNGTDVQTPEMIFTKLAPILGGTSLSVSSAAMSDLEALVAKLKNESEKTRFSMLLSSLNSISESLTTAQKTALEEGLKLSERLDELHGELDGLSTALSDAQAASAILEAKIKTLDRQIEQAIRDGKEHKELIAARKLLEKELDAKKSVIADTQGRISDVKNEIASVSGKISAIVKSIGDNTLKTIANEIADIAKSEKAESAAEVDKKEKKEADTDPFNAIRDSLEKMSRELTDTIEKNVEVMV